MRSFRFEGAAHLGQVQGKKEVDDFIAEAYRRIHASQETRRPSR